MIEIRRADRGDAGQVSAVIPAALRESNARDYSADDIERIASGFRPDEVEGLIAVRWVLVAVTDGVIVGTAALDGGSVRTVFVAPAAQSHGVGRRLMREVEALAADGGIKALTLRSSITAEGFYRRLGYRAAGEEIRGTERVIVMTKEIASKAAQSTSRE